MEHQQFLLVFHRFGDEWLLGSWIMGRSGRGFPTHLCEVQKRDIPFFGKLCHKFCQILSKCFLNASTTASFCSDRNFCGIPVSGVQESILIDFFIVCRRIICRIVWPFPTGMAICENWFDFCLSVVWRVAEFALPFFSEPNKRWDANSGSCSAPDRWPEICFTGLFGVACVPCWLF